ncbi:MAG: hypothetical protein KDD11_08065 [Acidobacteria bacterium]|nr:hypothetical protein [Acidobacteriota bacterium]
MEPVLLASLWQPIVLSAILVFIASSIVWMVLPHHRSDWKKLPDEGAVRRVLEGVEPGSYTFPYAQSAEDWKSEAWIAAVTKGPNGMLTVLPPGPPAMGKKMLSWFIYLLVVSTFVAYLTGRVLPAGTAYLEVFRVAGTAAFLAYSCAHVANAVWMGHAWSRTIKDVLDGLAYALLTAGAFGWLWP